ncbi:MAG: LysR substrate-binding domain-containing protein [Pseudomonadota bacterium]
MNDLTNADLKQRFFNGMSHAACTVNVVTTDGAAGRAGVTVSAMSSVSADTPQPTLLVCVHHKSASAAAILENGVFCVNVLRDDQSFISDTFAGRIKTDDGDKFSCADWTVQTTGAPRVVDPLVAFDCRMVSGERIGTHHVFLGAVEDIFVAPHGSPLIYANRAYGTPTRIHSLRSDAPEEVSEPLRLGCFHTFGPYLVPALLSRLLDEHPAVQLQLQDGDQRQVVEGLKSGETEIALLYDIDLGDDVETEPLDALNPYVLLAEGHPLAGQLSVSLEQLAGEPMILLDAPPSADYFLSLFEQSGHDPVIRFRSRSLEMVRGMVGHGLGYALLATKPASNMTYDGRALVARPLSGDAQASEIVLARKADTDLSAIATAFIEACRAHFRASV